MLGLRCGSSAVVRHPVAPCEYEGEEFALVFMSKTLSFTFASDAETDRYLIGRGFPATPDSALAPRREVVCRKAS